MGFPGASDGVGGRSQFRTPIVFADDEDTSEESSKPTFQAEGAPQGVQTLPGFPLRRFPVRRPYVPGQDKKPLLRGQQEVFVQEPGAPGGPWDGTTVALLLQPKEFNPSIQAGAAQTLPSTIQFASAQFNPQIQAGLAQTLPSPIQFADEEPKVLLLQPLRSQLLTPGRQIQGRAPGAQQGVQTLPSPIQFADTKQPYVPGGDKTPYL